MDVYSTGSVAVLHSSFSKYHWKCCRYRAKTTWNYIQVWMITSNLLFCALKQLWSVGTHHEELWRGSVVAVTGHSGTLFHPYVPWTPRWTQWDTVPSSCPMTATLASVVLIWRPDKFLCCLWVCHICGLMGNIILLEVGALPGGALLTLPKHFDWCYLHWQYH